MDSVRQDFDVFLNELLPGHSLELAGLKLHKIIQGKETYSFVLCFDEAYKEASIKDGFFRKMAGILSLLQKYFSHASLYFVFEKLSLVQLLLSMEENERARLLFELFDFLLVLYKQENRSEYLLLRTGHFSFSEEKQAFGICLKKSAYNTFLEKGEDFLRFVSKTLSLHKENIAFVLSNEENVLSEAELQMQKLKEKAGELLKEKQQKAKETEEAVLNKEKILAPVLPKTKYQVSKVDGHIYGRFQTDLETSKIESLNSNSGFAQFKGAVSDLEVRPISNQTRYLVKFVLSDDTGALSCKMFLKPEQYEKVMPYFEEKHLHLLVQATLAYDAQYSKDLEGSIQAMAKTAAPEGRKDKAQDKRVELHCHSQMSAQDAIPAAADIVKLAHRFGHPAVAITDHGVVQAFPEAYTTAKALSKDGQKIKLILGMEGYMIDDGPTVVYGNRPFPEITRYVAVDVETTGLEAGKDRIIEIAGQRFEKNAQGVFQPTESFQAFIKPPFEISEKITELTGITQTQLEQEGRESKEVMQAFASFVGQDLLCAHNALFDLGFLRYEAYRDVGEADVKIKFNQAIVDTVALARAFFPKLFNHKLSTVAKYLGIPLENHHRALDDARASGYILSKVLEKEPSLTCETLNQRAGQMPEEELLNRKNKPNHIILLAKDMLGLYSLYRLVSVSHVRYFIHRPRLPKSLISYYRAGMVISGACVDGDVFKAIIKAYEANEHDLEKTKQALDTPYYKNLARYYDYLEVQPLTNNGFLVHENLAGITKKEQLKDLNLLMIHLASLAKRKVCATCDAHYLHKEDGIYRKIIQASMGFKNLKDSPDLYLRSTDEMIEEFESYLPADYVREIVIENPQKIASEIQENLKPFPDGSFPPIIQMADEEVRRLTMEKAMEWYGKDGKLPAFVEARIEKELHSIIDNGFAIMYYIAHKLVKKSNDDGYIVGSRGSVGSSIVATLCGITEVNPLPAHYRCPSCKYSEFFESGSYGSGYDLPNKACPCCQHALIKEGQDIPFETFLGFNGDKQPDIDLNFSGEYQPRAHAYIEEMFGSDYTFRAGTIGSFAEKNALGLVEKYLETEEVYMNQASKRHIAKGIIGVKRTTGQHPGGIVVIPKERDIYEFTPIQFPANKQDSPMTTTHFDFTMMHDTILKLDVLGHDDPTMLRFLSVMTGIDVRTLPMPDEKVMQLFVSTLPLGIKDEESLSKSATLGLPEMGTFMAREMIKETKPTQFYDLVQLMGLSHGTDVWKGNAQDLIRDKICTINTVIGCRDSIMTTLIFKGLPSKAAFDIMERVRKGKGLSEEQEKLMREKGVEDWYIASCKKIKYMFPKAHAVAYLISALRIAWFKVYKPEAYYAAFFAVRADEFDASVLCVSPEELKRNREQLLQAFRGFGGKEKDKKLYYIAELVEEMYQRGIFFDKIDLMRSQATMFEVVDKGLILPPLNTLPGISTAMGEAIVQARKDGAFSSRDDLMRRAGLGASVIQSLDHAGLLKDLPENNQMDLFQMFQ